MLFWLLQEMLYTQTSLSLNVCMRMHALHQGQYSHNPASSEHCTSRVERVSPSPKPPGVSK